MKKLFYYATILFVIVACTKSEPNDNSANTPIVSSITLDKTSVSFDEFASVEAISFSATVDWVAEIVNTRADGWLSVSPLSGKAGEGSIIIKATENDTPDDRTASIIIKAGTAAKTINVSQKQKDALTVTSSKFEVSAEGGRVSIEVKANIDFNYVIEDSVSDWISYEGTRAIKSSTLVFAVAQNDDIEKREGKITIKSGEFSEEVTIYQAGGEPSIVISKNEQVVSSDGGVVSVEVSSNVDVVVEMPDVDWISENTTRAMSTNTYYFDIQPNDDYDQRSAEIKFINKDNNLSEEVAIIQAQKDAILISDKDVTISDIGGVVEFEVQANVEFEVTDPKVGWIRNITTRGLESHMLRYEIDVNTSYDHRSAEIIVTDLKNRKSEIITITQAQKDAIFVTNDNYTAGREEESIIIEISHNVDYNVDIDCDWIIRSQTRALERDYPTFTILENNTDEIRNGVITFTSNKKDISKTVHIRQRSMACEIHYTSLYGNIIDPTNQNVFGAKMLSNIYEKGKGVITFDDNITAIGYEAFQYRETLRSIVIPNKVTYIDNHAFYGCI